MSRRAQNTYFVIGVKFILQAQQIKQNEKDERDSDVTTSVWGGRRRRTIHESLPALVTLILVVFCAMTNPLFLACEFTTTPTHVAPPQQRLRNSRFSQLPLNKSQKAHANNFREMGLWVLRLRARATHAYKPFALRKEQTRAEMGEWM